MKRILLGFLILSGICISTAQGSWLSDGKYAAEFLSIGIDARALGMGGAYVAQAAGASAAYWNPAGLAHLAAHEVTLMHAEQFEGIVGYDYLGYGYPRRDGTNLGFGIIRLGVDDIPVTFLPFPDLPLGYTSTDTSNRVEVSHYTSDTEMAFFAGFGRSYSRILSYGASAKIIGKWIASNSAYGLGFDLGLRLQPWRNVVFGALLQDVTTTALIWDTGHKELIAPTLKLGGAYYVDFPSLMARVTLAADLDLRFTDRGEADQIQLGGLTGDSHLGLEYFINVSGNGLALRAGAEPSREPDEGFLGNYTFGAGLLFQSFHIDYAFLAHPELGDTHRIALAVLWGHRSGSGLSGAQ